ncbi:MAG: D-alanyl-D-alanine carboxypeptidase, partial [Cyclobacteriaceae bacterium]
AFSSGNFHDERFGPGWAWDDYEYSFSPERSAFPIYGNLVSFTDSIDNNLKVVPKIFTDSITISKDVSEKKKIIRALTANQFTFDSASMSNSITREIPFKINDQLISNLLMDTLKRSVGIIDTPLPPTRTTLYSVPSDSLYKVMMQESDNFIADQLLLMSAGILSDSLKVGIAIEYMKENWLSDLDDEPIWVDGSGLSRYNLFTPHAVVRLWDKLLRQIPQERLFALLATGGEAGTIKKLYRNERPFIYGKTGTLSNNHCLSGYLITKRKKVLIFSFMNNNYTTSTGEVRQMMDKILRIAHEKY